MTSLSQVSTFGGIDADNDNLLESCFSAHDAYLDARNHQRPFIIGRKGSGKTAIYRKLIRERSPTAFSFGHSFTDYPWSHHKLQAMLDVPAEHRYVQSWQYLMLITTTKILLNQDQSQPREQTFDELASLEEFIVDTYGTRNPDVTQVFGVTNRLRVKASIKFPVLPIALDVDSVPMSDLPKVVQEVNVNIGKTVMACLNPDIDYFICFDELDRNFDPTSPDYLQMLVGLLIAAKHINLLARDAGKKLSVVVFLRDDIFQILEFEDKNKIIENLISRIEWDTPRTDWTLKMLMESRFKEVLGAGRDISWDQVFDESKTMTGHQTKYNHMLDRTFGRPRDMIKLCNEVLTAYKLRSHSDGESFTNEDVQAARERYSEYLLNELKDEVFKHVPTYDTDLDLIRSVGSAVFTKEELDAAAARRPELLKDGRTTLDLLRSLFEFSIVSYQKTGGVGGGSQYVWRYQEPNTRFDDSAALFRIHPGLVTTLGLKKFKRRAGDEEDDE